MLKYRNRNRCPPGQFTYKDGTTGHEFKRRVFSYIVADVAAHRAGNNLPPISESEIEHQGCSKLGGSALSEFCESDDPNDVAVNGVTLHATDIARGTLTIGTAKLLGEGLVSREEAERRAAICVTCPFNVQYREPCGGMCGELLAAVDAIVSGERLSVDDRLHACAVCKCSLKAKPWMQLKSLRRYETEAIIGQYPAHCWLTP